MEKLSKRRRLSELQGIFEQLDLIQDVSCEVFDDFSDVSRSSNCTKSTIKKVLLDLDELKQDLAKQEVNMIVFGGHAL